MTLGRTMPAVLAIALAGLVGGCRAGNPANENDRLRAEVLELQDQVAALQRASTELQAEIDRATVEPGAVPETARRSIPHVTSLNIGRLSHLRAAEDARPAALVLYLHPEDGLGRFVQLAGTLSVHAALLPDDGAAITIGSLQLDPEALRAAYRSGFMGTHYTVELPVALERREDDVEACDVRVVYVDARTGRRSEDHRGIRLQ